MIEHLFVDIDDTLILDKQDPVGKQHPWLFKDDNYEPNISLIINLLRFQQASPDTKLFLWSGGGSEYAGMVGSAILPHFMKYTCIDKSPAIQQIVKEKDIFIDDSGIIVKDMLGTKALDFNDETHKFFYRIITADQFGGYMYKASIIEGKFDF